MTLRANILVLGLGLGLAGLLASEMTTVGEAQRAPAAPMRAAWNEVKVGHRPRIPMPRG